MTASLFMLDTNMASFIIKGNRPRVHEHLRKTPIEQICISAVTEAELLFGLWNKSDAHLKRVVNEFFLGVDILPWDSNAAEQFAKLRYQCERQGKTLGTMDMLIAAHAIAVDAVLVTHDRAFSHVKQGLKICDWSI